jgi:hypothetical protein
VIHRVWTSKLSTLKFTFGHILYSVEATIKVEVIDGRWPCGYQGVFTAKTSSINRMEVPLLAFEDGELPMADGRMVKLSRRVVSVELVRPKENLRNPKLIVCLKAQCINEKNSKVEHHIYFKPKQNGRSQHTIKVNTCKMQVTVAWSLLTT